MAYPGGLYSNGMHDFIIDEIELGNYVAAAIDYESVDPLGWYYDILYAREFSG